VKRLAAGPLVGALVLALAATGVSAGPASAQLFGGRRQDEAILQLQQEMLRMKGQLEGEGGAKGLIGQQAATQAELTAARAKLDDLEATLRSLNGAVEALTGELAAARRELAAARTANGELVERLARLESAGAEATLRAQAVARAADPATAWADARALYEAQRWSEAAAAFEGYATRHADQPNAAEAHYWHAEALREQKNAVDAAQAYIAALEGWPKNSWAPDALVKLSDALIELKETGEACKSLAEFDRRYGSAPAAVKTRAKAARTRAKCG
jgi:tol-pal system protein YbgF